jgi:hypothetical protein
MTVLRITNKYFKSLPIHNKINDGNVFPVDRKKIV